MDELLKALPPIIQAISIAVTAYFAVRSLKVWRTQMVGKRKFEVAEEVIFTTYKARDALAWIRNGATFSGEADDRQKEFAESKEDTHLKDAYYVPLKRVNDASDTFAALSKAHLLSRIFLVTEAADAIQNILKARVEVIVASQMLVRHTREYDPQRNRSAYDRAISKIWATNDEDDHLSKSIDQSVQVIEIVCSNYLKTNNK